MRFCSDSKADRSIITFRASENPSQPQDVAFRSFWSRLVVGNQLVERPILDPGDDQSENGPQIACCSIVVVPIPVDIIPPILVQILVPCGVPGRPKNDILGIFFRQAGRPRKKTSAKHAVVKNVI
jgi:hypothetical protein